MAHVQGDGGSSDDGVGGVAHSSAKTGVFGFNDASNPSPAGIPGGNGVFGVSNVPNASGVFGVNDHGVAGVTGKSDNGDGVSGISNSSAKTGVFGVNNSSNPSPAGISGGNGVFGVSNVPNASGVFGVNDHGAAGVTGKSDNGDGVSGISNSSAKTGVFGVNNSSNPSPAGIPGGNGVFGVSTVPNASGVFGANNNGGIGVAGQSEKGVGILGRGRTAGRFEGDVEVTGDIRLVNADCAEDFDVSGTEEIEPGTVMVLDQEGALEPSQRAYDKRVAGVISGAGEFKPGIVLNKQQSRAYRLPVALLGKVYCKVDARYAPIEIGDLLTSSPTLGHAMKAEDHLKAFGSVIGKALRPLPAGQGLVPILIALQ